MNYEWSVHTNEAAGSLRVVKNTIAFEAYFFRYSDVWYSRVWSSANHFQGPIQRHYHYLGIRQHDVMTFLESSIDDWYNRIVSMALESFIRPVRKNDAKQVEA